MLIKETIERECCESRDLSPYRGMLRAARPESVSFCRHCGELWVVRSGDDPRRLFDTCDISPRYPRCNGTD